MHYSGNAKRFISTHTTFWSCRVSLRLENSTTLIGIAVLAGTGICHAIYPGWCNCINHFFSLFFSGYKEHSDTGIKQASKKERCSIKQEVEVDTNIIQEKVHLKGYHIRLHIGHVFRR